MSAPTLRQAGTATRWKNCALCSSPCARSEAEMSHENSELPPELRKLEAALAARPMPPANPAQRARVMGAVRQELAARPNSCRSATGPRSFWQFAAGVAAALVLGINLSMSAANDT